MGESQNRRLHELLRRLGRAVHGSVVRSEEVDACLKELREGGWDAVMLLDAALVCRQGGEPEAQDATVRVRVNASRHDVTYRIDVRDAELLGSLGISPSRYRSQPVSRGKGHDESDR